MSRRKLTDAERIVSIREAITAAQGDWHELTALYSILDDLDWLLARAEAEDQLLRTIGRCACTIHQDRDEPCGFSAPSTDYQDPIAQVCDTCMRVCWGVEPAP